MFWLKVAGIVAGGLVLIAAALAGGAALLLAAARPDTRPFDAVSWRHAARRGTCTAPERRQMVPDLRARHLRAGMRIETAERLLGRPDRRDSDTRGRRFGVWLVWDTDASMGDCYQLELRFVAGRLVETSAGDG